MAATITLAGSTIDTNSGTHTVVATPALNDLIVIITFTTGSTASVAPTDTLGFTYSLVLSALKNSSADQMQIWVKNYRVGSAVSTTFTHAPGTTTGGGLIVYRIAGISKYGLSAIVQSAKEENIASGTPTPTFTKSANTNNAIITSVFNATNTGGITARSSPAYTRDVDKGYATPTSGVDSAHINSGETATAIAWGSSSASAFCDIAIEIDSSFALAETLKDSFDSSIDQTKWQNNSFGSGSAAISGGQAVLTCAALTANTAGELDSTNNYDFTGSYLLAQINQVTAQNAVTVIKVIKDSNNNFFLERDSSNNLSFVKDVAGSFAGVAAIAYNSSTMKWWRLRESGGTIFADYSSDGISWTNLGSVANPFAITNVQLEIQAFDGSSDSAPGAGKFDYVNMPPPIGKDSQVLQNTPGAVTLQAVNRAGTY